MHRNCSGDDLRVLKNTLIINNVSRQAKNLRLKNFAYSSDESSEGFFPNLQFCSASVEEEELAFSCVLPVFQ